VLADGCAARIRRAEPCSAIELFQVPAELQVEGVALADDKLGELQAGRSSVQNQDGSGHITRPAPFHLRSVEIMLGRGLKLHRPARRRAAAHQVGWIGVVSKADRMPKLVRD